MLFLNSVIMMVLTIVTKQAEVKGSQWVSVLRYSTSGETR